MSGLQVSEPINGRQNGQQDPIYGCVVIGAGPGGLGVAAMLRRAGIETLVLERGSGPGARWRKRYDRLRINTSALTSFLPGQRFPLRHGRWPSRDDLVVYYEQYARQNGIEIRCQTEAQRIEREDGHWLVETAGDRVRARTVVIATGKDGRPKIPPWPGRERFSGQLLHAAEYMNAEPFADRRVLVVGCGSSALDICLDLVDGGAARVWLAVRTPPHLVRRAIGGIPADVVAVASHRLPRPVFDKVAHALRRISFGDLTPYGLPIPEDPFTSRVLERGMIPTIDPGPFVRSIKRGEIRVVAAMERFDRQAAVLADGSELPVDAVIAATGYARGLEPLVGHLGVLDGDGEPLVSRGEDASEAPGLYFIGFTDVLTGNLREMRLDAKRTARAIARSVASEAAGRLR